MFVFKKNSVPFFVSIDPASTFVHVAIFLIKISPKKELLVLLSTVVAVYKDNILHVYNSSMYFQKRVFWGA